MTADTGDTAEKRDTCDRCHRPQDRIYVCRVDLFPFEGLCADCIDEMYRDAGKC